MSVLHCTVRYLKYMQNESEGESLRVCGCACGCMQARAAARLQAAPPAVAPGAKRAKKRGGAPLDTDCSSTENYSPSIETARHGAGRVVDGWVLDWPRARRLALSIGICLLCASLLAGALHAVCTATTRLRLESSFDNAALPPSLRVETVRFADAIRHPLPTPGGNVDISGPRIEMISPFADVDRPTRVPSFPIILLHHHSKTRKMSPAMYSAKTYTSRRRSVS